LPIQDDYTLKVPPIARPERAATQISYNSQP
jgi:hypothetical protein